MPCTRICTIVGRIAQTTEWTLDEQIKDVNGHQMDKLVVDKWPSFAPSGETRLESAVQQK
jgi:hypothetical protein